MKRLILLIALTTIVILPVSCKGGGNIKTSIGQQFTLAIGQTATFEKSSLSIKFVDVTQDSRCPTSVQCVQAGQAVCSLDVKTNGLNQQINLIEIGNTSGTTSFEASGISYEFKMQPYPEAGKQITKKDYRLKMTVNYTSQ